MKSKTLGIIIIAIAIVLAVAYGLFWNKIKSDTLAGVTYNEKGECIHESGICPFRKLESYNIYNYIVVGAVVLIVAFGIYLIFFEKSEKEKRELIRVLEGTKKEKLKEEKFSTLLGVLNEEEKNIVSAVKEQDGISQTTLRIRLGMSKSKLSSLLSDLEKRNLITKVGKGKVNYIYLKKNL